LGFISRKYLFDHHDLQFKVVKLHWKQKFLRVFLWLAGSFIVSYGILAFVENRFGSPKEKLLEQQIEHIKLDFSMLDRKMNDAYKTVRYLQQSDDRRYRPILNMDTIPSSYRNPAYGGVDRYGEFSNLTNGSTVIAAHSKMDMLENMAKVQEESYKAVSEKRDEWIKEFEHIPWICPVDVSYPRGDGIKLREVHPVWGVPKWHFGQDFSCPYGTEVYATGSGKVIMAGWRDNGFGYHVIIDHGYGFQSIYGHLSKINVAEGMTVKRGDILGLSGNSGTSSGPHLHYQVDLFGEHQNPLSFFADDLTHDEYLQMITALSSRTKFR